MRRLLPFRPGLGVAEGMHHPTRGRMFSLPPTAKRMIGSVPPSTPPVSLAGIVAHERASSFHTKLRDARGGVSVLGVEEAVVLGEACGMSPQEVARALTALETAGAVLLYDGQVVIRPEDVFSELHRRVDGAHAYTPAPQVRERLNAVRAQLRPLIAAKERCDGRIQARQLLFWGTMICYLGWQLWIFVLATFVWLDWDIMEPITFFWSFAFSVLLGLHIFRRHKVDAWITSSPEAWDLLVSNKRAPRQYRGGWLSGSGFDATRYAVLRREEQSLEEELAHYFKP
eukprot:Hpha_TRINITY_DN3370_c0_g1::TRINITY_DN3370_c0_g1_i1::g.172462::m.172462/K20858/MCU; calcium uniporter protein, mitochondrial